MPLLTHEQYLATMGTQPQRLEPADAATVEVNEFVASVPAADLQGHPVDTHTATDALDTVEDQWRHVLFAGTTPNVYLVVVLQGTPPVLHGHYLLDLNEQYGLPDPDPGG